MNLPKLNSVESCPKCRTWVRGSASMDYSTVESWNVNGETCYNEDHIERTCRCCGYCWKEACADAE